MDKEKRYYLSVFIGAISLGSFFMFAKHQYRVFKRNREKDKAKSTRVYTPQQLIEAIYNNDQYIKKNFKIIKNENEEPEEAKGQVFLQGNVFCNNPIISNYTQFIKNHPLIYRITYDKEVFSLDKTNPQDATYMLKEFPVNAQYEKVSNFFIVDKGAQGVSASIDFDGDCDASACLQYFGSKDKFHWLSISDRFISFILFLVKVFLELLGGKKNPFAEPIKGISLGLRETELGIKVDSFLQAYGEVIYNFKANTIRMEFPRLLIPDKSQYIKRLQKLCEDSQYLRNFYLFIFLLTMVYLGRRGFLYWKKYIQEKTKLENPYGLDKDALQQYIINKEK